MWYNLLRASCVVECVRSVDMGVVGMQCITRIVIMCKSAHITVYTVNACTSQVLNKLEKLIIIDRTKQ